VTKQAVPLDRRTMIADAAIEIVATQGIRALTHNAVDGHLELAKGSTSYYFRTKRALLEAAVLRITDKSVQEFMTSGMAGSAPSSPEDAALAVAEWLDGLLVHRRADVTARYALAIELSGDRELHERMAVSFFSRDHAIWLCRVLGAADPESAGADFVSLGEGLLFDRFAGARSLDKIEPGTPASVAQLARPLASYLRGLPA